MDQIIVLSGAEIVREANGVAGPGSDNAGVPVRTGSAMGPETIGTHELDVSPPRSAFGAQNWVSGYELKHSFGQIHN